LRDGRGRQWHRGRYAQCWRGERERLGVGRAVVGVVREGWVVDLALLRGHVGQQGRRRRRVSVRGMRGSVRVGGRGRDLINLMTALCICICRGLSLSLFFDLVAEIMDRVEYSAGPSEALAFGGEVIAVDLGVAVFADDVILEEFCVRLGGVPRDVRGARLAPLARERHPAVPLQQDVLLALPLTDAGVKLPLALLARLLLVLVEEERGGRGYRHGGYRRYIRYATGATGCRCWRRGQ